MLTELVRRYQSYDPETGRFDRPRGVREYARLLGVNNGQLSQILNGIVPVGLTVARALARTFPEIAGEVGAALIADAVPDDERQAVTA
jgi:DNA-binding transcriptional regulator YdaS (Cro superfamily)